MKLAFSKKENKDWGDIKLVPPRKKTVMDVVPKREVPEKCWRYVFAERPIPGVGRGIFIRDYCGLTLVRQDYAFVVDAEFFDLSGNVNLNFLQECIKNGNQ